MVYYWYTNIILKSILPGLIFSVPIFIVDWRNATFVDSIFMAAWKNAAWVSNKTLPRSQQLGLKIDSYENREHPKWLQSWLQGQWRKMMIEHWLFWFQCRDNPCRFAGTFRPCRRFCKVLLMSASVTGGSPVKPFHVVSQKSNKKTSIQWVSQKIQ